MTSSVYLLKDPVTKEVCYIGKSAKPEKQLLRYCKTDVCKGNINRWVWIVGLQNIGSKPDIVIIKEHAVQMDKNQIIQQYWEDGHPLLNKGILNRCWKRMTGQELYEGRYRMLYSEWYTEHRSERGLDQFNLIP